MFPDRKAFNFFKSYWEVAKELDNKSRLEFYDALMRRQFTGEDSQLSGMAKFAWISQRHSIDSQVNGLLYKSGMKPTEPPPEPPTAGATEPPPLQVQVQVQEEEEVQGQGGLVIFNESRFNQFWDLYDKKVSRPKAEKKFDSLSEKEKDKIFEVLPNYIKSTPDKGFRKDPTTWLNNQCWNDEIIIKDNGQQNNNTGRPNTNNSYVVASTTSEKLIRKITEDFANGGVPGQY